MKKKLYIGLLGFLMVLMVLSFFKFKHLNHLDGYAKENLRPAITLLDIFSGKYQDEFSLYYNDRHPLYAGFVRLRNQIYYSLFSLSLNQQNIVGKHSQLYERGYIESGVFGKYTRSEKDIEKKSKKIALIQDTLQALGKDFLVVFAPGKGTYYPEYIPDYIIHGQKHQKTSQQLYMKYFDKYNVNYIDFDSWFISRKEKEKYPVYTPYGVHWTQYGSFLAMDSLVNYFSAVHTNLPVLIKDSLKEEYRYWFSDCDIYNNLNLIKEPETIPLGYFYYHYDTAGRKKLKCISVADSYYWQLWNLGLSRDFFLNGQFWYYFNEINYLYGQPSKSKNTINIRQEIVNTEVVLMLFTNASTLDLDNGFTDSLYSMFFNKK